MDGKKKDLERLEADLKRLGDQVAAAQAEVGRRLPGLDAAQHDSELAPYLESTEALRLKIEDARSDLTRLGHLVRKLSLLEREREEAAATRDRLLQERQSRFLELGTGAYALYRSLPDSAPWRPLFAALDRIQEQAAPRENELRSLEERESGKGFLDRMKLKARKLILRGELSRFDKARAEACAEAGPAIAASEFQQVAQGPLRELFETLESRRRAAESLAADNIRRAAQREEFRRDLERLGALADPEAAASTLKRRIEGLSAEREVVHAWLGRLFLERGLGAGLKDADVASRAATVAALQESMRERHQQIDRIRAEGEMEELAGSETASRERRRRLETSIADAQRGIDHADIEINTRIRRREELRRVIAGEIPYAEPPPR